MIVSKILPLLLVIICNIGYHLLSKSIPNNSNPFLGLVGTYAVACLGSLILFLITRNTLFCDEKSQINVFNILIGIVVIGVEGGYMLMYRTGWEISKASLVANICLSAILVIIGVTMFKENLDIKKIWGLLLCVSGVFFLKA